VQLFKVHLDANPAPDVVVHRKMKASEPHVMRQLETGQRRHTVGNFMQFSINSVSVISLTAYSDPTQLAAAEDPSAQDRRHTKAVFAAFLRRRTLAPDGADRSAEKQLHTSHSAARRARQQLRLRLKPVALFLS
jgi:hypothetical protein